jgi:hypothetical protein
MATILDKVLIRESTVKIGEREILITLTADQRISFRLKGMKSGVVSITIEELYKQLSGIDPIEEKEEMVSVSESPFSNQDGKNMISLNDLRSFSNISNLDYPTKAKFDSILKDLIKLE